MESLGLEKYEGTYLCDQCRKEFEDGKVDAIRSRISGINELPERTPEPIQSDDETTGYLEEFGIL